MCPRKTKNLTRVEHEQMIEDTLESLEKMIEKSQRVTGTRF